METTNTSNPDARLEFNMYHEGRMVEVRVEVGESDYGVHIDDELVAVMEVDENGFWDAQDDFLDEDVIEYIGKRINDKFE